MKTDPAATPPVIEYFYSAHSAFAWIGSARLQEIARAANRKIIHRPFDFMPVIAAANDGTYPVFSDARRQYFFGREIDRWAEFRGVQTIHTRPRWHDEPLTLPNGLIIAAQNTGLDVDALSHAILGAHWREDANINDPETLTLLAKSIGITTVDLVELSLSQDVQKQHSINTKEAVRRSVFGSPTYFLDGDMFYGQDHLEMLERALSRPFVRHS